MDLERQRSEDQRIAQAWAESCQKHATSRRECLAWEWLNYHQDMLRNHEHAHSIIAGHHRQEILRYLRIRGIGEEVA